MNRLACLLVFLPALVAAADKPDPKADHKTILGKWKVVAATFDGKATPLPADAPRFLAFDEKEFVAFDGDRKVRTLGYALDPAASPKRVDVTRPGADQTAAGLYVLDRDKLTLCYGEPGAERPTKLESKAGSKAFLMELVRVKK